MNNGSNIPLNAKVERRNAILLGVSDLIQQYDDSHFDMSNWVSFDGHVIDLVKLPFDRKKRDKGCDTACCLAGWTIVYALRGKIISSNWQERTNSFLDRTIQHKACEILELTERQAEPLFIPFGLDSLWVRLAADLELEVDADPLRPGTDPKPVHVARLVGMIVNGTVML